MFTNKDHQQQWLKLAEAIEDAGQVACTNDPDGFFPENNAPHVSASIKQACAECPIRLQCAEYGIWWEPNHGIWGGLAPRQRKEMRAKMRVTTSAPSNPKAWLSPDQSSSLPHHELFEEELQHRQE